MQCLFDAFYFFIKTFYYHVSVTIIIVLNFTRYSSVTFFQVKWANLWPTSGFMHRKLLKSSNFWLRYSKNKKGDVFGTHCNACRVNRLRATKIARLGMPLSRGIVGTKFVPSPPWKSQIAHLDMHHLVFGINFQIHSVSLAILVSIHLFIQLSTHLCHHLDSRHLSLLHSRPKTYLFNKSFPP